MPYLAASNRRLFSVEEIYVPSVCSYAVLVSSLVSWPPCVCYLPAGMIAQRKLNFLPPDFAAFFGNIPANVRYPAFGLQSGPPGEQMGACFAGL